MTFSAIYCHSTMIIGDPCYNLDVAKEHAITAKTMKEGYWIPSIDTRDHRVASLYLRHTDAPEEAEHYFQLGTTPISVDSGTAGIFSLDTYADKENLLREVYTVTTSTPHAGEVTGGFAASSGYGDGRYRVYACLRNKRITHIWIDFGVMS